MSSPLFFKPAIVGLTIPMAVGSFIIDLFNFRFIVSFQLYYMPIFFNGMSGSAAFISAENISPFV